MDFDSESYASDLSVEYEFYEDVRNYVNDQVVDGSDDLMQLTSSIHHDNLSQFQQIFPTLGNDIVLINGNSVIIEACENFAENILIYLVESVRINVNSGIDLSSLTSDGNNLQVVDVNGNGDVCDAPPPLVPGNSSKGITPLFAICSSTLSKRLDKASPELANRIQHHGLKTFTKSSALALFLIQNNAIINLPCKCSNAIRSGNYPLHAAVLGRDRTLVKALLLSGAKLDVLNDDDDTPVILAARVGDVSLVNMLVDAGALLDQENKNGQTAAQAAFMHGHITLAMSLLTLSSSRTSFLAQANRMEVDQAVFRAYGIVQRELLQADDTDGGASGSNDGAHQASSSSTSHNVLNEVSAFCHATGLGHLIPLFREQNLTLKDFLIITDSDLLKIGVTKMQDRRTILDRIQKMHKVSWDAKQWPNFELGKPLTLADLMDVLLNSQSHLSFLSSTAQYINKSLALNEDAYLCQSQNMRKPVLLSMLNSVTDSIDDANRIIQQARESKVVIEKLLNGSQEDSRGDCIDEQENLRWAVYQANSRSWSWQRWLIGASVASVVGFYLFKKLKSRI